jgi:uncharacterized protein (DUF2164 family)
MSIELAAEAKRTAIESIQKYFETNMNEPIGNLAAGSLLSFILEEIGPTIYNKGVADAQERIQSRLSELDIEVHEEEFQYWRRLASKQKGRK